MDAQEVPGNVMLSLGGLESHRQGGDKNIPGQELDEQVQKNAKFISGPWKFI